MADKRTAAYPLLKTHWLSAKGIGGSGWQPYDGPRAICQGKIKARSHVRALTEPVRTTEVVVFSVTKVRRFAEIAKTFCPKFYSMEKFLRFYLQTIELFPTFITMETKARIIINIGASADHFGAYAENCEGIYAAGDSVEEAKKRCT